MAAKLEFGRNATNAIHRIGVSSEWVAQAVHTPDNVQKIMPNSSEQRDWPIISLYIKRFRNGVEESLLLVQALKQSGTITVSAVWQIYPDDLGITESATALDVFNAFLEKYGVQLRTAQGLTRLVTYQIVASSTTVIHGKWERTFNLPEGVLNEEDRRISQTPEVYLNKWARQLNVKMHVAMLYTVNLSNYFHDLATHHATRF